MSKQYKSYMALRQKFRKKIMNLIFSSYISWEEILRKTNILPETIEMLQNDEHYLLDIVDLMELENVLDFQIEFLLEEVWEDMNGKTVNLNE